ncbi:MAG: hypothetical protein GTO45_18445, partial [Candidatus Aminicenantes bacterium]|nr:hypothetical protein [Candidatus Aminicenantes bacterium]NIN43931.1 hypothetical protein [Candidatus Aminicenantes bacterium]NIN86740.1 hypothetical protein [Candidatus Aminicenantes bacterium]
MRKYVFLWLALLLTFPGSTLVGASADGSPVRVNQESGKKVDLPFFKENEEIPEALRLETFDVVWEKIRDDYYDPTFNGLDWNGIRETYQ